MSTAAPAISSPVAAPDERVQALRDHEHARALLALGGARHRADRGARHAVAQHQQVAGERRHQPVRAQLGDRRGGAPGASRSRAAPAGRTPWATCWSSAPDATQPRLAWATHARRRTDRAATASARRRPCGFTLPDRSDDPPPAATSSGSERHQQLPRTSPTREILGVPVAMTDYQGAVEAIDAMVESRERGYVCAVVGPLAHESRSTTPRWPRSFRGATLVAARRHAGRVGREHARRAARGVASTAPS